MTTPNTLLKTKLYIPQTRSQLVPRPQLLARLEAGLVRKLTVISAPPGFGKTTLLSAWVYQHHHKAGATDNESDTPPTVSWVSLDELDNDPVRFWSYIIAGLETVQANLGADAKTLLAAPQPPPIETTLTTLINALADLPHKIVLILDDYHIIENETIHHGLTFLLDHLPPQIHLIMTSRADPPLPLTRLRVRGQLNELREGDLRFTAAEVAIFLNQIMGLNLLPADVAALEARTEGWIAGLQLAALSMQGRDDTGGFVRAFTGSHRYVIDYLAEEVLAQQPEPVQKFLLQTSILERLSGPLCDAIISNLEIGGWILESNAGPSIPSASLQSQEILTYLEQANLFLIPLDDKRRWYRYHHLFADFLKEQLHQTMAPQEIATLHQQASRWHAANNLTGEAINHALAANQVQEAARLIEQAMMNMLVNGEVTTIINWIDSLPQDAVLASPRLSLGKGWAMVIINQWDSIETLLAAAEEQLARRAATPGQNQNWDEATIKGMQGEASAMRGMVLGRNGNARSAIEVCERALERLPPENRMVRSIITLTLGPAYEATGDLARAIHTLTETVSLSMASGNLIVALTALSNIAILEQERGNLHRAKALYRQGIEIVEQRSQERGQQFPAGRWAYMGLAELHREWNLLEEAKRYLTISLEMPHQIDMLGSSSALVYLILARVLLAQGDGQGAMDAIDQATQQLQESSIIKPWVDAIRARLCLAQGHLAETTRWAQTCQLPLGDAFDYVRYPGEYGILARVYLAQGQFKAATSLLQQMYTAAEKGGRSGRLIEIIMLQALAMHLQSQSEAALAPLSRALALAEPGGYVRLFVNEGLPMAQLLHLARSKAATPHKAYLDKLLDAFPAKMAVNQPTTEQRGLLSVSLEGTDTPLLIEPLSDRETEVLRLIAAGLSNRKIAEELVITVGTAKTHANNIYRKLDVNSRTQAVARATELGLL